MDTNYFRGVAIGLTIAWVTTAIAYYLRGYSKITTFILFELVVSVIMFIVAFLISKHIL